MPKTGAELIELNGGVNPLNAIDPEKTYVGHSRRVRVAMRYPVTGEDGKKIRLNFDAVLDEAAFEELAAPAREFLIKWIEKHLTP